MRVSIQIPERGIRNLGMLLLCLVIVSQLQLSHLFELFQASLRCQ